MIFIIHLISFLGNCNLLFHIFITYYLNLYKFICNEFFYKLASGYLYYRDNKLLEDVMPLCNNRMPTDIRIPHIAHIESDNYIIKQDDRLTAVLHSGMAENED